MRNFGRVMVGAAVLAAVFASGGAYAIEVPAGSLAVSVDSTTLTPGPNIVTGTDEKSISGLTLTGIGGNLGDNSGTTGVVTGATVSITPQPIPVPTTFTPITLVTPEVLTIGTLTFTFTTEELISLTPQTSSTNGFLSLSFFGSFSDSSGTFSDSTGSMGETCTQASGSASNLVSCTESLAVPGTPLQVPEPATLALLGSALVGFGVFRRKTNGQSGRA